MFENDTLFNFFLFWRLTLITPVRIRFNLWNLSTVSSVKTIEGQLWFKKIHWVNWDLLKRAFFHKFGQKLLEYSATDFLETVCIVKTRSCFTRNIVRLTFLVFKRPKFVEDKFWQRGRHRMRASDFDGFYRTIKTQINFFDHDGWKAVLLSIRQTRKTWQ
jgi:hypothetical protein